MTIFYMEESPVYPSATFMFNNPRESSMQYLSGSVKKVKLDNLNTPPKEMEQGFFLTAKCM